VLAHGLQNRGVETFGVIVSLDGKHEQRKARPSAGARNQRIALPAIYSLMGPVIQLNSAQEASGLSVAEHEVQVFAGNPVEGRAPRLGIEFLYRLEHVGHPDFGKDLQSGGERLTEHLKKSKLGRGE
jgi:hypothetical protein